MTKDKGRNFYYGLFFFDLFQNNQTIHHKN